MNDVDEQFILNEEALDDLYAWIDTIPLSRPKKNIARDFSDGVLCAEAMAYFMPKMVDTHNYFAASSVMQKKVNWNTLNRKVFQKMGIRLSDSTIQQLVEAKPGAIEQVLWDIRRKVQEQRGQDQRTRSSKVPNSRPGSGYQGQQQQQYQQEQVDYMDSRQAGVAHSSTRMNGGSYQSQPTSIPLPINYSKGASDTIGSYKSEAYMNGSNYQTQGYIVQPGRSPSAISNIEGSNNNSSGAPSQIVYRGHKMVALHMLEEKERELKSLESANKNLVTKIHRIETLVNVKDQRIEDLTHQLHNLRAMYERVTQQTWQGY